MVQEAQGDEHREDPDRRVTVSERETEGAPEKKVLACSVASPCGSEAFPVTLRASSLLLTAHTLTASERSLF